MKKEEFLQGIRHGIPICLGYFSVSFAFGMTAVIQGLPLWAAVLISLTNLTSAGQFAGLNLIVNGGSAVELIMTTLVINIRYFLMSLSISQKVEEKMTMKQRFAISFGITDEIFAVGMQYPKALSAAYMAGLICTPVLGWTLGTLCGGAITSLMPKSLTNALGIALYGMFIAIIVSPARKSIAVLFTILTAALMSGVISFVSVFSFLRGGWGIIIITIIVSVMAALLFPIEEKEGEKS